MAKRLEEASEGLPQSAQPEKIHKTADPRPHYAELDALRGIAILGIVVAHALWPWYIVFKRNPLIIPLLNIDLLDFFMSSVGPFCLGLFFLLSGYLLTWTEGSRASKGNYSLRAYALRRIRRLVPAYYAALALLFLLQSSGLLLGGTPPLTDTLIFLGVLQGVMPHAVTSFDTGYWYLTSEVVFYALLPLLILKIRGLYQRLALFGVLATVGITHTLVYVLMNTETPLSGVALAYGQYLMKLPVIPHLWLFMAGALLRTLVEHLDEKWSGSSRPTVAFLLFAGSLVLLVSAAYVQFIRDAMFDSRIWFTVWLAIPFFAAALLGSPVLSRILSWRLLGFVGVISYSLYLLHATVAVLIAFYVLPFARPLLRPPDATTAWIVFTGYLGGALVVAGALAYLGYRYIESPFLRYKPE